MLISLDTAPYKVALWDLDNCLFDDKWRAPLIDWHLEGNERYNRYDAQMHKDKAAHIAEWKLMSTLARPVFITGRREKWRDVTRKQIMCSLPLVDGAGLEWQDDPLILMRPNDCDDKPVDVKRRLLVEELPRHRIFLSSIIAAFDDLPSIVQMYHEHGIPAAVLRVHDPKITYKPQDM